MNTHDKPLLNVTRMPEIAKMPSISSHGSLERPGEINTRYVDKDDEWHMVQLEDGHEIDLDLMLMCREIDKQDRTALGRTYMAFHRTALSSLGESIYKMTNTVQFKYSLYYFLHAQNESIFNVQYANYQ